MLISGWPRDPSHATSGCASQLFLLEKTLEWLSQNRQELQGFAEAAAAVKSGRCGCTKSCSRTRTGGAAAVALIQTKSPSSDSDAGSARIGSRAQHQRHSRRSPSVSKPKSRPPGPRLLPHYGHTSSRAPTPPPDSEGTWGRGRSSRPGHQGFKPESAGRALMFRRRGRGARGRGQDSRWWNARPECERRGYAARGLAPARRGGDGTLKAEVGPGRKGAGPASVEAGLRG